MKRNNRKSSDASQTQSKLREVIFLRFEEGMFIAFKLPAPQLQIDQVFRKVLNSFAFILPRSSAPGPTRFEYRVC
jgi:hypothetical protein